MKKISIIFIAVIICITLMGCTQKKVISASAEKESGKTNLAEEEKNTKSTRVNSDEKAETYSDILDKIQHSVNEKQSKQKKTKQQMKSGAGTNYDTLTDEENISYGESECWGETPDMPAADEGVSVTIVDEDGDGRQTIYQIPNTDMWTNSDGDTYYQIPNTDMWTGSDGDTYTQSKDASR